MALNCSRPNRLVYCHSIQWRWRSTYSAVSSLSGSQYLWPHLVGFVCSFGPVPESEAHSQKCPKTRPAVACSGRSSAPFWRTLSVVSANHALHGGQQTASLPATNCVLGLRGTIQTS